MHRISSVIYEWVMSRILVSFITLLLPFIWMSPFTCTVSFQLYTNKSCYTYSSASSRCPCLSKCASHTCDMSHSQEGTGETKKLKAERFKIFGRNEFSAMCVIWLLDICNMTHLFVRNTLPAFIWMSHVTHTLSYVTCYLSRIRMGHATHIHKACHTNERVLPHMTRDTNESWHEY